MSKPEPHSNVEGMKQDHDGMWLPKYRIRHIRYLFDGGATADVMAIVDDSYLRRAILDATGQPGIVGATYVEAEPPPSPPAKPAKTRKIAATRQTSNTQQQPTGKE